MALFLINRYLGEEEEDAPSSESRSQALLAKLQKQAKSKEQQTLAANVNARDTSASQQDLVSNKRKLKQQEKEKKPCKKSRKEGVEGQDDAKDCVPVERAAKTTNGQAMKKKKKKDKKETITKEEEQHTGNDPSEESHEAVEKTEGNRSVGQGQTADAQSDKSNKVSGKGSSDTSFHILGGFEMKKTEKVQRVLPKWLAEPDAIQRDIRTNLVPLCDMTCISPMLQKQLEANGIQHLFPVQAEVIPAILESVNSGLLIGPGGYRPRDICVSAPTGSGKTLAFVIPVIQALLKRVVCEIRALAVLPTKELAQQVYRVFCSYTERTNLKVVMVAGQRSLASEQAALSETRGGVCCSLADIVVATPGRLVDHINNNDSFSLQHLRFLIIDEADRMIDSMDQAWLNQVTRAVYKRGCGSKTSIFRRVEPGPITVASLSPPQMPLQKLLFSATLTQNPEKLQQLGLHQPRLFSSTHTQEKLNFPQGLTEYCVLCTLNKKPLLILHFLLRLKFSPVLCFTNSRETAHRLFLLVKLYGGVEVAEFSSRLSNSERQKNLKGFEQGKIPLLISTDAAARGIDIKGVKCVINYDAPQFIRTYVHRVGRTARAGKTGVAFTFVLGVQKEKFEKMVRDAGSPGLQKHSVNPESLKGMESRYEQVLEELGKVIREENAQKHF
ncbi:ATP-dependent RNA helicase DDX51 [Brachyhypopomus gauderio]|uniref:ATP-dependent RNA helicase DDX51 n=1 Tax=Brachyhypopomus gauderio TaxID=698409 RepID=UPI0040411467